MTDLQAAVISDIAVPGSPFGVVATPDGAWVLASISGPPHGLAVLRQSAAGLALSHLAPLDTRPLGIALSRDGSTSSQQTWTAD